MAPAADVHRRRAGLQIGDEMHLACLHARRNSSSESSPSTPSPCAGPDPRNGSIRRGVVHCCLASGAHGIRDMKLPGLQEWLFSIRTFAAAMLALYIGFAFDLDRPYWAMASAYIASQPFSGATRSKAVYRAMGTVLGAIAAVVLVPNLVNAPVLLSLALVGLDRRLPLLRAARPHAAQLRLHAGGLHGRHHRLPLGRHARRRSSPPRSPASKRSSWGSAAPA